MPPPTITRVQTRVTMITPTVTHTDAAVHGDLPSITRCPTVLPHPALLTAGALRPQSSRVTHAAVVTVRGTIRALTTRPPPSWAKTNKTLQQFCK